MIENISIQDMKNAQKQHKDLKIMMITPEQLEQHKAVGDCWIVKLNSVLENSR
jgi:hypothetical protein